MDTEMRLPSTASSAAIYFCSICDKPFKNESSHKRHLRYCGSRLRNRPRSCRACNIAKTKCSFETPCLRCKKKGTECTYEFMAVTGSKLMSRELGEPSMARARLGTRLGVSNANEALYGDNGGLSIMELGLTRNPAMSIDRDLPNSDYRHSSMDLISPRPSINEFLTLDGLLAFEDVSSSQCQSSIDFLMAPYEKLDTQLQSWCGWIRRGVSLKMVTENSMVLSNSIYTTIIRRERSLAQHNAEIVIQSLRSFPSMMLRRETFPWHVHRQSQLLSDSTINALPEALSNCMSIAQLFELRTPETRPFLWRTIRAEYRRLGDEMYQMSKYGVLTAVQSCLMYLIMCIIDQSSDNEENSPELLMTLQNLYNLFKKMSCTFAVRADFPNSNTSWENWIFDESQRRLALLWFLIGCVVCVKTGNTYDASQSYMVLRLPCTKTLWEAPTQSAWELEREAARSLQMNGLVTLGDLIDAQQSEYSPSNANKLDKWNAGVDNLGSLLNLVGAML